MANTEDDEVAAFGVLHAGVSFDDLVEAVARSGHPMQATVAERIRAASDAFDLRAEMQEEWAYVDTDSSQTRSIDIFTEFSLPYAYLDKIQKKSYVKGRARALPCLNLLVECKQSEYPYVFFLRDNTGGDRQTFPEFAGIHTTDFDLLSLDRSEDAVIGPIGMSLHDLFGVWSHEYFARTLPAAISFSKVQRKSGGKVEITGEEAYRSLTLPLLKAADHLAIHSTPGVDEKYFRCRIVICIAIVRAPMFGVETIAGKSDIRPIPWARVCRIEPTDGESHRHSRFSRIRYYDVVHESKLEVYFDLLYAACEALMKRLVAHMIEVAEGSGFLDLDDKGNGREIPSDSLSPLSETIREQLQQKHRGE